MGCMACLYFFGLAISVCRYDYGNSELNLAVWQDDPIALGYVCSNWSNCRCAHDLLPDPRSGSGLRRRRQAPVASHGHPRQTYRARLAMAGQLRRKAYRIDPAGMRRPSERSFRGLLADPFSTNSSVETGKSAGSAQPNRSQDSRGPPTS
jgi:hypothetical protein